jgi:beta-N-acetylhexosaminidase
MKDLAGRVMWIGLPGRGTEAALERAAEVSPGGVVLFARDIDEPGQVHDLVRRLREQSGSTCLPVALDQEGGRVDRLRPLLGPSPPARRLSGGEPDSIRAFGTLTGRALRLLGFNVDFAPVLDLDHGQEAGAIGDRSWGGEPKAVARSAAAFLQGLSSAGVAGCLKHWPGLGRARSDPHHELPIVEVSGAEMEEEQRPFLRLLSRAPFVMTAHCLYPAMDDSGTPATCSPLALAPLRESGFDGCLVADDLEMGAIEDIGTAAVASLEAGCDALLVCGAGEEKILAVRNALASRADLAARMRQGAERLERAVPGVLPPDEFDPEAWAALVEEYRRFCDPLVEAAGEDPTA